MCFHSEFSLCASTFIFCSCKFKWPAWDIFRSRFYACLPAFACAHAHSVPEYVTKAVHNSSRDPIQHACMDASLFSPTTKVPTLTGQPMSNNKVRCSLTSPLVRYLPNYFNTTADVMSPTTLHIEQRMQKDSNNFVWKLIFSNPDAPNGPNLSVPNGRDPSPFFNAKKTLLFLFFSFWIYQTVLKTIHLS